MANRGQVNLELFLNEICAAPFGSLSKLEIENLIFKFMVDSEYVQLSDGVFSLSMKLKTTQSKTSNLIYTYRQRLVEPEGTTEIDATLALPESLANILKNTNFEMHNDNQIRFGIEDPFERARLKNLVKRCGFFADSSFNAEIITLGDKAFLALIGQFELFSQTDKSALYRSLKKEHISDLRSRVDSILATSPEILKAASGALGMGTLFDLAQSLTTAVRSII